MTSADLVTTALKRLRVIQAGHVPSAEDELDGFARFQSMLRSWNLQRGMISEVVRTTWPIVPSQASYTVGVGAQINIPRPASPQAISRVTFQDTAVTPLLEYQGAVPLSEDQYATIPQKSFTSTYPNGWYYQPDLPYGTLSPIPIPTGPTLQGVIYVPTAVTVPSAVTSTITVPDGYDLALSENLAVLLAPEWGVTLDPALVQSAREAKAWVRVSNLRMADLDTTDVATALGGRRGRGRGRSNPYTGVP